MSNDTTATETITGPFASKQDATAHRWFSRRHETPEAHRTASTRPTPDGVARWEHKLLGVQTRIDERAKRTPVEQLAALDRRLGDGVGATRERARLQAVIAATA